MRLSAWTSIRKPPSARYTSANFDPSLVLPESTPRLASHASPLAGFTAAAAPPAPAPRSEPRVASAATPPAEGSAAPNGPSIGSWVIQVGSFNDAEAAQLALGRATMALSENQRLTASASIDEVQMANKVFHRARLTNLSQAQAVDGCKRLEKKKIYCSAIQVTAWNTPNAR
jgi:hypothetical protein